MLIHAHFTGEGGRDNLTGFYPNYNHLPSVTVVSQ